MSWYVEEGIGEHRAIRMERGHIAEARLHWPGSLTAGQVEEAVLIVRAKGSHRGTARFGSGEEALVDKLPANACEGAPIRLEVVRPALKESGRRKLAQARPTSRETAPPLSLAEQLAREGHAARVVRAFPEGDWDDLWLEAWQGHVAFAGGSLIVFDTPAMTLIDLDGDDAPAVLAKAAVGPLAAALRRFDLGGSIGIDFPTLATKAERKAIDMALDEALSGWPHERTAMNGFGFVQIVARLARIPITRRIGTSRVGASARRLLRQAEQVDGPGAIALACHPAVKAKLKPAWLDELTRRTGREVRIESDPALALEAGFAQAVPL